MSYTPKTKGYSMESGRPTAQADQPTSHFVPAAQYLRDMPVKITMADAAAWHAAAESKRPVKCIAQMLGAYRGRL